MIKYLLVFSLKVWMVVEESLSEYSGILHAQLHGGSQSDCLGSALENMNASLEEVPLDAVGSFWGLAVEAQMSSIASNVADLSSLPANSFQLNLEEAARVLLEMEEVLRSNNLPDIAVVEKLHHINVLLERCALFIQSVVEGRVESAEATLATEGHEIWSLSILKVPVLMSPVLA